MRLDALILVLLLGPAISAVEVSVPHGNYFRPGEYLRVLVTGPVTLTVGSCQTIVSSNQRQIVPVLVVGDGPVELTWPGGRIPIEPINDEAQSFRFIQPQLYESLPRGESSGVRWRVAIFGAIYTIIISALLMLRRKTILVAGAICGLIGVYVWRQSLPAAVVTTEGDVTYVVPRASRTAEMSWQANVYPVFSSDQQPIQLDWDARKFLFAQPMIFVRRGT